jgi:hypothetical protein
VFIGYDLWASGAPLPATFYAKQSTDILDLPRRWGMALRHFLSAAPPLGAGLGWLALLGLLPLRRTPALLEAPPLRLALLPAIAAAGYLSVNLYLIDPVDPDAFYHHRYLLPALPLTLVALTLAASRMGAMLPVAWSRAPLGLLALVSLVQASVAAAPESRHLHNDVRNINEVQRSLGEWLGSHLPAGTWIAASDAGAVRYFSGLPTIDVLGLNTPEMLVHDEEFVREHPVAMMAVMPAWFTALDPTQLVAIHEAQTEHYTVTGSPDMARQVIMRASPAQASAGGPPRGADGEARVRVRVRVRIAFEGLRSFALDFLRDPPTRTPSSTDPRR